MRKKSLRLTALVLAFALLLASCGGNRAEAATMKLAKTEGTVSVSDGEGRDVAPAENLGLYSGYQVGTQAESYAWINLDDVKLTKMDAASEIEITKDGKKLDINVRSGALFFNITEPLADDETLEIRTATMVVGIRGTCGWVTQDTAALLDGTVTVSAGEQSVTVAAGEMAVLTADGALEVTELREIPAFVQAELADNEALAEAIEQSTGMQLPDFSAGPEAVLTMPVTVREINRLLSAPGVETVTVQPGSGGNVLHVEQDEPLQLRGGKTLIIEDGVDVLIGGADETADGAPAAGAFTVSVQESASLQIGGNITIAQTGLMYIGSGTDVTLSQGITVWNILVVNGSLRGGVTVQESGSCQVVQPDAGSSIDSVTVLGGVFVTAGGTVEQLTAESGANVNLGGGHVDVITVNAGAELWLAGGTYSSLNSNGGMIHFAESTE